MKKTLRMMMASALIGATGLAAAAQDYLLPFKTISGSAFTQYFSLTADAVDSLYLSVVGSSVQYSSLSFVILANDTIHVNSTSGSLGQLDASFDDLTNTAYSLGAGQTYSLVVSGVTNTLANGVSGVVTISGFDGAVSLQAAAPVASVPEPETWAMLLAGLGFVGVLSNRRARKV
jgi:hypothetical protein